MIQRTVTEHDFRMPEFRDAKPEDYEFREDGKIVRKDRWETGIRRIVSIVGLSDREFEIPDVVDAVRAMASRDTSALCELLERVAGKLAAVAHAEGIDEEAQALVDEVRAVLMVPNAN